MLYGGYREGVELDDEEDVGGFKVMVEGESLEGGMCVMVGYGV